MIKFLQKILSIFLVFNHLWMFNIVYAIPLDIRPDRFMDGQFVESETVHKMHPVRQENGLYNLSFSDSLSNMGDDSTCFLFDEDNEKIIGRLVKKKGMLGAYLNAPSVHLTQTPQSMLFTIEAEGSLSVGGSVQNQCVLTAQKITFDEKIDTSFSILATARHIQVNAFLKGDRIQLNAEEKGCNNGEILSKNTGIMRGHWENKGVIASGADILCDGASFFNYKGSRIIAGKSYQNSCESTSEEGSIKARLGGILSGSDLKLTDGFHFEGASFSTLHQNLWFDEDKSFLINVQNFINMQCDVFKGYEAYGKFNQDRNFNTSQSVTHDLSSYFQNISLNQTDYIPQENAFIFNVLGSIPDKEEEDAETKEIIPTPVATLEWFSHIFTTDGSVVLKADTLKLYGSITHGKNAYTLLKAAKQIETYSNALGKRVYIDSPINFIGTSSDNEDYTFLKADELYFSNEAAENHINQNLLVKKLWAHCQDIDITGDVLGYDHEPMPQIFLSAPDININLDELEASQFIVRTLSMAFYWDKSVTIQEGYIDGKYYTLSDQSYVSFREYLDSQKIQSTIGKMVIDASLKSVHGNMFVESLETKGRYCHLDGNISGNRLSLQEEESVILDAQLNLDALDVHAKTVIQSGASTVKTLLIEATKHVSVSNMMANVAAIFGSSKQDLDVYIGDSNIQKLLVDVSNGAVLLKHVVAHNAKILCQQFDAMNDLRVGNLDIKALSHISIQRIQVEKSLNAESGGNTSVSDVKAENSALGVAAQGNARVDGADLNGCTAQIAAQGGASVENSAISNSNVEAKGTSVELSQNTVEQSAVHAQGKSVHMDENEFASSYVKAQANRAVFEGTQISDSQLHVATKQSARFDETSAIGSAINVAAGTDVSINQMKAENSALGVAAQGNALVHGANLNGCTAQIGAQGVTSFEHGAIAKSNVQFTGQHVCASQNTFKQSTVYAQGESVHVNGNDGDASQITAQGTRIVLSGNEINNSNLQARGSESVRVDQTTGTGNTINIESDQVFMADNTLDESRLSVKANRVYIEHLFGSYNDFQLKVNHLRLSGEALVQQGSIDGRDEGVLPYLDISDLFKVGMHSKENTPRPSFVIKCQGFSNLQGLEVEGDGSTHLQAVDLTQRPDFTHLEGYAIYLDIAPKTHEDVIKLAQDLSRVANVEINAKDVVLMLESDRIYFSQNLKLHLKGVVLNESTIEGAGDLSLWTSENIESTKSFLSAKGELVAFAGGHLLRTGSKTYSGKGTSLISGGHMQDLAHVDTKKTEKIDRHSCELFSYSTSTTTTTQTSTVCSDVSDASILKFVGGDYEGQGASVQATETNLVFNGKFKIDVAYDFWQEQSGNHYVRSKKTPVPSDFKGAVKIHVNGTEGGSITAPKTDNTMEIIRDELLPPVKISLNLAKITEYAFDAWETSSWCGFREHHHQRAVTKEYYQTPQLGGDVTLSGPLTLMYQKAVGHQHKEYLGFFRQIVREITDPLMTQETDYISHLKIAPEQLEEVIIKELYKHEYHKQSHWSVEALMIVGISVALITGCVNFACLGGQTIAQTAGASFASSIGCAGGTFATGFGASITIAGISSVSIALMQADGNPVKAIKSMMNAKTFGTLLLSGVTGGACQWLGAEMGLLSSVNNFAAPALNTAQGIQYAGMCATINAVSGVIQGQDLVKSLGASAVGIGVQAVGTHCLHLPNAEALQVGLAAAGGAIGGAITGENPLLSGGAGAAGAIMNLMIQDLKIMGIADNWQDAVKQIATTTTMGMAGFNPLYVSSGWQQARMQIQYNREEIRKKALAEAEAEHSKKMMQDAEAKEIQKERARQYAAKEEQAKAREQQPKKDPFTQAQKDAYTALAHDVTHPFGEVQENELQSLFYDHHEPQNASGEDCYLSERIKKTEALEAQAESQGRFDDAEIYADIASRLYAQRPPSPTIQDTAGRQAAHRFNDRFIPNFVKKGVHFVGQEIHDFGQNIDDRFNAFLKNPSLKTFHDAQLTLKALKEGLGFAGDVICTTVDHTKSFARRGLRVAGMDAGNAQDLVDAAEIATCIAPVLEGAYVAAASTKIGVKTASAFRSAVHEISSATRFGLDILEDYAQFKARGPQLVYARSRAFDRTFSAPKRAHSSILFQERSSRFNSQGGHQSSKASAAPKAQQAPVATAEAEKISWSKAMDQAAQDVRNSFNGKLNTKGRAYSEWYIERQVKGAMGEKAADLLFARAGYQKLPSKLAGNKGIDGVYVKWKDGIVDGIPEAIYVVESKFASSGKAAMNKCANGSKQMDKEWIDAKIFQMEQSTDLSVKKTGDMLKRYRDDNLIKREINVLDPIGINRWNTINLEAVTGLEK